MEAVQEKTSQKTQRKALQKKEGGDESQGMTHAPPRFQVDAGVNSTLQTKTENGAHLESKGAPQFQLKAEEEKARVQKKSDGPGQFNAENAKGHSPANQPMFQAKLEIGKSNDKYEKEADSVAAQAMKTPDSALGQDGPEAKGGTQVNMKADASRPAFAPPTIDTVAPKLDPTPFTPPTVQKKESEDLSGDMGPERISLNPDFSGGAVGGGDKPGNNGTPNIQKSGEDGGDASGIESTLNSSKGGGSPLDSGTKNFMEPRIGADFSDVRVHTGSDAVQMSQDVGAQAFAHGKDVYFNEGKYNPGSDSGKELLAHELTHTVQQGASPVQAKKIQKKDDEEKVQLKPMNGAPSIQRAEENAGGGEGGETEGAEAADTGPLPMPATVYSITNGFKPKPGTQLVDYLASNPDEWMDVKVKMHSIGSGTIKAKQVGETEAGQTPTYEVKSGEYVEIKGLPFLAPLAEKGITPILALKNETDPKNLSGLPGFKKGKNTISADLLGLFKEIVKNKEALGLNGLDDFNFSNVVSAVGEGKVDMMVNDISMTVGDYLDAKGSFGFQKGQMVFDVQADVDVKGLAQGSFSITKGEQGLQGEGEIGVELANVSGTVNASFDNGAISIQGTATYESDKFTGNVNLLVTDKAAADAAMYSGLGIDQPGMDNATQGEAENASPVKLTKENAALVGWGDVEVAITDWLTGKANVGIDSDGYVTVIGEIGVNDPVTLMEQNTERKDLFKYDQKFPYGVPLVGNIFVFVGIGMYVNYGFGPLSLRDVKVTGQYSTRPDVPTNIKIGGALNINAFASLGLEARGGAGVTLLGHDIKAGIKVTGEAGIKAYAEAAPELEYKEAPGPNGGMVGETWLNGHFEAAAQMFLKLGGAFFIELDSPWWSPAPDDTWEWPFGSVEYPLGTQEYGVGGDVAWKVGSKEWPELKMSPVEFDSDKFLADMTAKPKANASGKGGEKKKPGKWEDGSPKGGDMSADPKAKTKGGGTAPQGGTSPQEAAKDQSELAKKQREAEKKKGEEDKKPTDKKDDKKKDDKKDKDEEKEKKDRDNFKKASEELSDLAAGVNKKPVPDGTLRERIGKIKAKYSIDSLKLENRGKGRTAITMKEGSQKKSWNVKVISGEDRDKQFAEAVKDLEKMLKTLGHPETGAVTKGQATTAAKEVDLAHEVIVGTKILDHRTNWTIMGDVEEYDKRMAKRPKAELAGIKDDEKDKKEDGEDKEEKNEEQKAEERKHQTYANEVFNAMDDLPKGEHLDWQEFMDHRRTLANQLEKKYNKLIKAPAKMKIKLFGANKAKRTFELDVHIGPNDTDLERKVIVQSAKSVTYETNVGIKDKNGNVIQQADFSGAMENILLRVREITKGLTDGVSGDKKELTGNLATGNIQISGRDVEGLDNLYTVPLLHMDKVPIFASSAQTVKKGSGGRVFASGTFKREGGDADVEWVEKLAAKLPDSYDLDVDAKLASDVRVIEPDPAELKKFLAKVFDSIGGTLKYSHSLYKHSEQAIYQLLRLNDSKIAQKINAADIEQIYDAVLNIHTERDMCKNCAMAGREMVRNLKDHAPNTYAALMKNREEGVQALRIIASSTFDFNQKAYSAESVKETIDKRIAELSGEDASANATMIATLQKAKADMGLITHGDATNSGAPGTKYTGKRLREEDVNKFKGCSHCGVPPRKEQKTEHDGDLGND